MTRMVSDPQTLALLIEVEQFLYAEAECLDDYRLDEWLALFADDLHYWVPLRKNVRHDQRAAEYSRPHEEISWFEENKGGLARRVRQIQTGVHWAEEPLSRTSHLVTNVRLGAIHPDCRRPEQVEVRYRFLVYRNRLETETDVLVGKKEDSLILTADGWKIRKRKVMLDQNVLLAKNLSFFL
ncbi:MAG: 3-phenylpropionate/cinnamic acid dioxygenase subunit beta [Betaproteobacteria bacterium]|nr:3-phenylpropionate/cinnamic acid dioxygenase subunit beta [Betaproteobacteria bacterium]